MIRHPSDFSLTPRSGATKGNLFRSGGKRKDVIYCRFFVTRNGRKKEFRRSTGETTVVEARAKAWAFWQEARGLTGGSERVPLQRATSPKLGKIVDLYVERRTDISEASEHTVTDYIGSLRRAVQLVEKEDWRDVNLSRISDDFMLRWWKGRYAARGLVYGDPEDVDESLNASLNSETQNMRAIFGRHALQVYKDEGMVIPDSLQRFLTMRKLPAEEDGFEPIPSEDDLKIQVLCQASIHRARGIEYRVPVDWAEEVPPAEIAVACEMARFAALTRKEIYAARVDWFAEDLRSIDVRSRVDEKFRTKRGKKNGIVPLNPNRVRWWFEALGSQEFVLPGEEHPRWITCRTKVGLWLAPFLSGRRMRLHELRKMAGWDVWKASGSLSAAAAFLRDREETARKYYLPKKHNAAQFGVEGL
ncbi:MAG: hypothetical protein AAGJ81_10555 [Verrucomicrobiota bacterium]